jgi:hypothetical protein
LFLPRRRGDPPRRGRHPDRSMTPLSRLSRVSSSIKPARVASPRFLSPRLPRLPFLSRPTRRNSVRQTALSPATIAVSFP